MSFPPPPGLPQRPPSSQPQAHPSLPPRPPTAPLNQSGAPGTSTGGYNHATAGGRAASTTGYSAFTAFQPRAVAANQSFRSHSPAISSPATPVGGYPSSTTPTAAAAQITYSSGYQYPQQYPQQYGQYYGQPSTPHIQNPFPAPHQTTHSNATYGPAGRGYSRTGDSGLDPETEAQIAQWQSAYMGKEAETNQAAGKGTTGRQGTQSTTGAGAGAVNNLQTAPGSGQQTSTSTPVNAPADPSKPNKTVVRSGGGQTWTDSTLLEWDPAHFRLFVGNLAGEVTDDSLLKAFSKYPSVQKARVIRDKRTEKSKGYGFVSFSDGDDYFRAAKEMQGKYVGSHPVLLRRATTEIKPVTLKAASKVTKKGSGGGGHGAGHANGNKAGKSGKSEGGVQKKQAKTKGGLRVLG